MTISTESEPNKGWAYKRAWDTLFAQLTPAVQAKVLAAKGNDKVAPEAREFFKAVIAMAEQDDSKKA